MKKIIIAFSLLGIFAISCNKPKGKEVAMERTDMSNSSNFQVHNATIGSTRSFLQVDAKFVNGNAIGYGATFPSTPASFNITSGFRAFNYFDTTTNALQVPLSFGQDLQADASYTMFTYDSINAPKQLTVYNKIVVPNDTTSRLRFANFIYNSGSSLANGFDIFSVKRNAVIFSNVSQTQVTDYIPYASALTDTFYIRLNGSATNLQNVDTTGKPTVVNIQAVLNPTRLRSYTLIFRGGYRSFNNRTTTGALIPGARQLGTFINY